MTTKVQKWGNSLAVRLPKEIANQVRMREGSVVSFSVNGQAIVLERRKKPRYTLEELMKNFDKKKQHKLIDWGPPVGSEVW